MIELLVKQWAEIAPGTCQAVTPPALTGTFRVKILPDLLCWHWIEFTDGELSLRDIAVLQFAVQQAIVARGMYFELRYWPPRRKYRAEVGNSQGEWFDNPAAALLSAYLKALGEVEKKG